MDLDVILRTSALLALAAGLEVPMVRTVPMGANGWVPTDRTLGIPGTLGTLSTISDLLVRSLRDSDSQVREKAIAGLLLLGLRR